MANNLTLEDIDNLYLWYTRLEGNELGSKEEILDIEIIEAKNSLPKEVFKLNSLEWLKIEVKDLTEIPKEIENLSISNLINLDIIDCHNLKELPKEIGNLTNLINLGIIDCPNLGELPKEIGNLTNLHSLDIEGCHNLKELPKEIGNLTNLEYLTIESCHNLKELPKEYWNKDMKEQEVKIKIENGDNIELLKSALDSAISNSANKSLELRIELKNLD